MGGLYTSTNQAQIHVTACTSRHTPPHNHRSIEASSLDNLLEAPADSLVVIDEAQFAMEHVTQLMRSAPLSTYMFVAVLSGSFQQRGWDGIGDLLAAADHIVHTKAKCSECGNDAPFTVRTVADDTLVLCGASNIYQPRCREHIPISAQAGCL